MQDTQKGEVMAKFESFALDMETMPCAMGAGLVLPCANYGRIAVIVGNNGDNSPVATINANCAHCRMTATVERLTATIEQLTATIERLTAKGGAA